jgi:lysophospholipase L1-like esterase
MRRWLCKLFAAVVLVSVFPLAPVKAVDNSIWSGNIQVSSDVEIDANDRFRANCEYQTLSQKQYRSTGVIISGGNINLNDLNMHAPFTKEECVVQNKHGLFGGVYWSPSGNPADVLEIPSTYILPVPASNVLLFSFNSGTDPYGSFRASINYNFPAIGKVEMAYRGGPSVNSRRYYKKWTVTSSAPILQYSNASPMLLRNVEFSKNGKYAISALTTGMLIKIDLQSQEITPIGQMPATSKNWALAISNDGNYALSRESNTSALQLHDITGCLNKFSSGNYPNTGVTTAGCVSRDIQNMITNIYPSASSGLLYNYIFSPDSASFNVDVLFGTTRRRLTFAPEDYVSSAQGYLAMGDSYTSGEGDTEGGVWYEQGTDEQGDKTTFAGRNLCHLSRRSYPYLMAIELGYLSNNVDSPPADGLFHSVACSGAKIHNIIGIVGEKQDNGGPDSFAITDNQYRYVQGDLESWQVGYEKQIGYLGPRNDEFVSRVGANPEIITLGIGGNDAGFGDFLKACSLPGTCDFAVPGSKKATQLISTIAQNKARLTSTYKQIKQFAPSARVYVHGYPKFVEESGGYCALNVPFDDQERLFTSRAIEYMNDVVEASAQEAGVFYVDVEDIFTGRMLCSDVDKSLIVMNGATAGNDVDLGEGATIFDVKLGQGICITNCLGNESFHPTPEGFKLYKQAILSQTNNLQAEIPAPTSSFIPTPMLQFGLDAVSAVSAMNSNNGYAGTVLQLDDDLIADFDYSTKIMHLNIQNLMPNSSVQVVVESEPTVLGTFPTDVNGNLLVDVELPANLEAGYHEIHILGQDKFVGQVDYRQSFVLAEEIGDFDGDGVEDTIDSCPSTTNSSIDLDEDGIDDACDSQTELAQQEDPEEPVDEEPIDDEPAEFVDKGTPSNETVTGDNDEGGAVLGASTTQTSAVLSATGNNALFVMSFGVALSALSIVITIKSRRKPYKY